MTSPIESFVTISQTPLQDTNNLPEKMSSKCSTFSTPSYCNDIWGVSTTGDPLTNPVVALSRFIPATATITTSTFIVTAGTTGYSYTSIRSYVVLSSTFNDDQQNCLADPTDCDAPNLQNGLLSTGESCPPSWTPVSVTILDDTTSVSCCPTCVLLMLQQIPPGVHLC